MMSRYRLIRRVVLEDVLVIVIGPWQVQESHMRCINITKALFSAVSVHIKLSTKQFNSSTQCHTTSWPSG